MIGRNRRWIAAVVLAGVLAPADPGPRAADDAPRGLTFLSRNLYVGADPRVLADVSSYDELIRTTGRLYRQVLRSGYRERAKALAAEIEETGADIVGLQEVALWRTDRPADGPASPATKVSLDFLKILQQALAARGLRYEVVVASRNADVEAPTDLGFDIRITDRDVLLARRDLRREGVRLSRARWRVFSRLYAPSNRLGQTLRVRRGWTSVDVSARGLKLRVINTHLEGEHRAVQEAQAAELLVGPARTRLPVVLIGDLNSPADGSGTATYTTLLGTGFRDAWAEARPDVAGNTCCHGADLRNLLPMLDRRIDFVLYRGPFTAPDAVVVGDEPGDQTPSGLWPSDHTGVAATLQWAP